MLSSHVYVIVTTTMNGVISYFPYPGVARHVVSICIPSEQEFGGSVEIRRSYTAIPNGTECKDPVLLSMPA